MVRKGRMDVSVKFGLNQLEKHINEIEESDPVCINYPRLKKHDDKTGIMIYL